MLGLRTTTPEGYQKSKNILLNSIHEILQLRISGYDLGLLLIELGQYELKEHKEDLEFAEKHQETLKGARAN